MVVQVHIDEVDPGQVHRQASALVVLKKGVLYLPEPHIAGILNVQVLTHHSQTVVSKSGVIDLVFNLRHFVCFFEHGVVRNVEEVVATDAGSIDGLVDVAFEGDVVDEHLGPFVTDKQVVVLVGGLVVLPGD